MCYTKWRRKNLAQFTRQGKMDHQKIKNEYSIIKYLITMNSWVLRYYQLVEVSPAIAAAPAASAW